jgi:hypothetical protein
VRPEGVRFQDIDFVAGNDLRPVPGSAAAPETPAADENSTGAIVELHAWRAEFRGCSFQAAKDCRQPSAAIRWCPKVRTGPSDLALPSGTLRLTDCTIRDVCAGVVCPQAGAVCVELTNTLDLAPGPLVRLDRCPKADEPVVLRLSHVTLRAAGPLLECRWARPEDSPGAIAIQSDDSVFLPERWSAVIALLGPGSPQRLFAKLRWTGQGSLVAPDGVVAAWRSPDGKSQPLDDASAAITGLVRSEMEFAGRPEEGPRAQRLVRWQAPLSSTDVPGIDPARLTNPAADVGF